jgi:hypothetical protein
LLSAARQVRTEFLDWHKTGAGASQAQIVFAGGRSNLEKHLTGFRRELEIDKPYRLNTPPNARGCPRIDRHRNSSRIDRDPLENASGAIVEWQKLRCYKGIMQKILFALTRFTDEQLLREVRSLAGRERNTTAPLIAALAELDARQLYLGEGYPSLYAYCTQSLHLSEHAAYGRIKAARAVRRWPVVLDMLAEGSITLTTVCLLASHLTTDNHLAVLEAAKYQSRREVERQVAALWPLAAVPSTVRRLPADEALAASQYPGGVTPLAPECFKVQFTISGETYDRLRRVQDLLRHAIPNGGLVEIFDRAVTLLLGDLERKKLRRQSRDLVRGTYRRRCGARCGGAMGRGARLWALKGGARSGAFWSSIMWCRSRWAGKPRLPISNCAAAPTTSTRRSSVLARARRRRSAPTRTRFEPSSSIGTRLVPKQNSRRSTVSRCYRVAASVFITSMPAISSRPAAT